MQRIKLLLILACVSILTACQASDNDVTKMTTVNDSQADYTVEMAEESEKSENSENSAENAQDTPVADKTSESIAPTKEQVLAAREIVLDGMTAEQIDRLTENIKIANSRMEQAYLYDNIFGKLEDENSLYWNYFDQKGDIQIDWTYDGAPVVVYNRFDADNFIDLMAEMQESVQNEDLREDLQQLIDETALAKETHDMEHANNIYKILHDMDYYLLRYGLEDVGIYVKDASTLSKYYGVLTGWQQ
ncbi:MAG: hypothetical protein NC092_08310 [Butyrivibrio sp.]|nr:hypothetical protein [Muribaculum sp.]MCM1552679.1 hypothetical protein [Butyrivibrio sp.]